MKTLLFVSSFILCLGVLIQYSQSADTSMVLYLPLDENAGNTAADLSNYKNDAVLKGSPKWVPGKFGSAIEFGTGKYLQVADSNSLDVTKGLTINCWVKIVGETGDNQSGVEKGAAWVSGEYNLLPVYGGAVLLQAFDLPEACNDDVTGGNVVDNQWHFVAGVWDGKDVKIYVDAKEARAMGCVGEIKPNAEPLFIGCRGGTGRWVNGTMDEIKIYNRGLSIDEIAQDMKDPRANTAVVNAKDKLAVTWGDIKVK